MSKEKLRKSKWTRICAALLAVMLVAGSLSISFAAGKDASDRDDAASAEPGQVQGGSGSDEEQSSKPAIYDDEAKDMSDVSVSTGDSDPKDDKGTTKTETVYVVSEPDMTPKEVIVSDWLQNADENKRIDDISTLSDIRNVKGDEEYKQSGESVVWDAGGSDIYYQGSTDQDLPVSIKAEYYLNGERMKAEDMAGKSGSVEIHLEYKSDAKVAVDGDYVTVPFAAITGLMVSGDDFSNITVNRGQVVNTGDQYVVVGVALPGLPSVANLETDMLDMPENVVIKADTINFNFDTMITILTTDFADSIDMDDIDSLDDIDDAIGALEEAAGALDDGAKELYEGVCKANDAFGNIDEGAQALEDGMSTLYDGVIRVNVNMGKLTDGSSSLVGGSQQIYSGLTQFKSGMSPEIQKAAKGVSDLADGLDQLKAGADQLDAGIGQAASGISQLKDGAGSVKDGTAELTEGLKSASDGLAQIAGDDSLERIISNLETVKDNTSDATTKAQLEGILTSLESVKEGYSNNLDNLSSGVSGAATSAGQLSDGAKQVYNGISGLDDSMGALKSGSSSLKSGLDDAKSGAEQLNAGVPQLKSAFDTNMDKLISGSKSLKDGASALNSGLGQMKSGTSQLAAGAKQLDSGTDQLANGTSQFRKQAMEPLEDGSKALSEGMSEFKKEGIDEISEVYNDKVKGNIDRFRAALDAGRAYDNFSGIADDTKGSVKFIIRSEGVSTDDDSEDADK